MADLVRLTEASLREAMREDRYWRPGHSERDGFAAWVTGGWQALTASRTRTADGKALVHVRAYARTRNGVAEKVSAYTRSSPAAGAGHSGEAVAVRAAAGDEDDLLTPAGGRGRGRRGERRDGQEEVTPRLPNGRRAGGMDGVDGSVQPLTILPSWMGGRGGRGAAVRPVDPGRFQQRIPGLSGKEGAKDVPSWAQGQRPYLNETPEDFARRMMNERYSDGWYHGPDDTGADSEFSRIQKYARGFRNP